MEKRSARISLGLKGRLNCCLSETAGLITTNSVSVRETVSDLRSELCQLNLTVLSLAEFHMGQNGPRVSGWTTSEAFREDS